MASQLQSSNRHAAIPMATTLSSRTPDFPKAIHSPPEFDGTKPGWAAFDRGLRTTLGVCPIMLSLLDGLELLTSENSSRAGQPHRIIMRNA